MPGIPANPKIYHIVHVDRLPSIIAAGCLWSDAEVSRRLPGGTTIGMTDIKHRRLKELTLSSHPDLHVGDCVPFYFCPRSIMLYLIHQANHPELSYRDGQGPIVHLEADLGASVAWAEANGLRWAFTLSNAGARYFEDRADLAALSEIDWAAVSAVQWQSQKEGKQAEFLMEQRFPWKLVERVGVHSVTTRKRVLKALQAGEERQLSRSGRTGTTEAREIGMLRYKTGDILQDDAEALVNTVNCVGVMGRGVALQFKKAFPQNFRAYAAACKRKEVCPGRMFVFETGALTHPRFIINFPTKRHWRGKSRLSDIEAGLHALVDVIRAKSIRSVAVPPLGSGLGGLAWPDVKRQIEAILSEVAEVDITVYEPSQAREVASPLPDREAPRMTPGRAALIALMDRYLRGLLDPFVTLLEIHKLMYFMQEAGEPLRLRFEPGPYGPYAENLRHVLHAIEGHFVTGYADGGDIPAKRLELLPGAIDQAESIFEDHPATRERLDKVAALVSGFESPYGLELLSTVQWVAKEGHVFGIDDVVSRTHAWSERKRRFTPRQIALATEVLANNGWIESVPFVRQPGASV